MEPQNAECECVISEVTEYVRDGSRFPAEAEIFVLAPVSISFLGKKPTQRVGIKRYVCEADITPIWCHS